MRRDYPGTRFRSPRARKRARSCRIPSALAILGDREVEAEPAASACHPGRVLLRDGQPGGVSAPDQQGPKGEAVLTGQVPLRALPRVEMSGSTALEASSCAASDPAADDPGQLCPLRGGGGVEQLFVPTGVDDGTSPGEEEQAVTLGAPPGQLLGLSLESVEIAHVEATSHRPVVAIAVDDLHPAAGENAQPIW